MARSGAMKRWPLTWVLISLSLWLPSVAYADSPALAYLRAHLESLQQVLCSSQLADQQHLASRRKLERIILHQLFDFEEMSRRALGGHAVRYQSRISEFTPLFVAFLEHAYIETLEENGDAAIRYTGETAREGWVEISTKTRLSDGSQYSVDYRLSFGPQGWRAYDVAVEGVSLVDNYRSQFERVLRRKSFDELLQDLKEKKQHFD